MVLIVIDGEDNSGSMTSKSKRNAFSPQKEEGKSKLNARSNGMLVVMVINKYDNENGGEW